MRGLIIIYGVFLLSLPFLVMLIIYLHNRRNRPKPLSPSDISELTKSAIKLKDKMKNK